MTYFYEDMIYKACDIIKGSEEFMDVSNDINKIRDILYRAPNAENLNRAYILNCNLRIKYPTINQMMEIANRLAIRTLNFQDQSNNIPEYIYLEQDIYGILCYVLLKKGCIHSIEQIIKKIE